MVFIVRVPVSAVCNYPQISSHQPNHLPIILCPAWYQNAPESTGAVHQPLSYWQQFLSRP
ncbi:uncharacterized protein BDZ83DRAFT_615345 [Colletotrichum acutatum]|uniref:Uncharacterized protein n=1 Tax=Glomerella acutata TaxID=27357 RepID=A0AAD8UQY8_GLOAC|nr:uncharacterized protein BDZ83DRAFT_615345 [Colletotrichum acutatum]KAK1726740.1 hypothetical protein BDZ83DRAFT_615345 [Colletotrichum acutatum]